MLENNHLQQLHQRAHCLADDEQKLLTVLERAETGEAVQIIAIACPILEPIHIPVAYDTMLRLQHSVITADSKRAKTLAELLRSVQAPLEKAGIKSTSHLLVSDMQPLLYAASFLFRASKGRNGFSSFISLLELLRQQDDLVIPENYLYELGYKKSRDELFTDGVIQTVTKVRKSALNIVEALQEQRPKCKQKAELSKVTLHTSHAKLIGNQQTAPALNLEKPIMTEMEDTQWKEELRCLSVFLQALLKLIALEDINWDDDTNPQAFLEALYYYDLLNLTTQLTGDKPSIWLNMQDPNSEQIALIKRAHGLANRAHPDGKLPFPVVISAR